MDSPKVASHQSTPSPPSSFRNGKDCASLPQNQAAGLVPSTCTPSTTPSSHMVRGGSTPLFQVPVQRAPTVLSVQRKLPLGEAKKFSKYSSDSGYPARAPTKLTSRTVPPELNVGSVGVGPLVADSLGVGWTEVGETGLGVAAMFCCSRPGRTVEPQATPRTVTIASAAPPAMRARRMRRPVAAARPASASSGRAAGVWSRSDARMRSSKSLMIRRFPGSREGGPGRGRVGSSPCRWRCRGSRRWWRGRDPRSSAGRQRPAGGVRADRVRAR